MYLLATLHVLAGHPNTYLLATLHVLATFEYMLEQFSNKKKKAAKMFAKQKLQVNTMKARCSSEDDEKMIRAEIEMNKDGYEIIDEMVQEKRTQLVIRLSQESSSDLLKQMAQILAELDED